MTRLLLPASLILLAFSLITLRHQLTVWSLGMLSLWVIVTVIQCVVAARTQCPLCMTPVLSSKFCAKHKNARTLLGSHRLRVAVAVVFRNSFRCPYCNEPTCLEVRTRGHYSSYSGS